MPLFSCNQATFTAHAGYEQSYALPEQLDALKAQIGYVDPTPESTSFYKILGEVNDVTRYWQFDEDDVKDSLFREVDEMYDYSEENMVRLLQIKEQIAKMK